MKKDKGLYSPGMDIDSDTAFLYRRVKYTLSWTYRRVYRQDLPRSEKEADFHNQGKV
jgi:hypothetical protein